MCMAVQPRAPKIFVPKFPKLEPNHAPPKQHIEYDQVQEHLEASSEDTQD